MSRIAILIVAAGKGERTGRAGPKQYEPLAGRAMLRRTAEAFSDWPVRVVIGPGQEGLYQAAMGPNAPTPVIGGAKRQDSVRLGLEALEVEAPDFILIHDAARPLVSRTLIERTIAALEGGAAGAVPMLAVADTLRRKDGQNWVTVPRDGLQRAQTPQGFRFAEILKAHRDHADADATDDVAIAGLAGLAVEAVMGEESNLKVTTEKDFVLAERYLGGETRTAMGYDAHRFTDGDHVWLCGVQVPHDHGLEGHSDADAGLHALTDAVLGCISA
ncbi:MAG: 2-C-methyl-D-erythritol 4-phosphate cytidylyltransferase, partial [Rhizomicrobium sp.]